MKKVQTTLSNLLDAEQPLFAQSIEQLELASSREGRDVRLISEIIGRAQQIMLNDLKLDFNDTTGPELYKALNNKVAEHDEILAKSIGGKNPSDIAEMMPLIKAAAEKIDMPRDCWVLKKSVAKEFLRKNPPKNIMKKLGYTNVDSMLKKENLGEIFGALRFAESDSWLREFNKNYERLRPSDFTTRDIEIITMPADRWSDIAEPFVKKKKHNITHLKELGIILMLPMAKKRDEGVTLKVLPLLLHYFCEIRLYSSFFKLKQVSPNFGKIFVNTLIADPDLGPIMAGQNIHWRVIQRYFGKLGDENHPEIFQPHVQPEDLHWRKAEDILYEFVPELEFWRDLDYVGLSFSDGPVAFNLMDVSVSFSNQTPYEMRNIYHFRESLWNEVFIRYMGSRNLEEQILEQLDNDMIEPEKLDVKG